MCKQWGSAQESEQASWLTGGELTDGRTREREREGERERELTRLAARAEHLNLKLLKASFHLSSSTRLLAKARHMLGWPTSDSDAMEIKPARVRCEATATARP